MKFFCTFLLVTAAIGTSAKPQQNTSYQYRNLNDFNSNNGPYRPLPVVNTHIQTSVVENPTVNFPNYIPPLTISESCHCLNTFVRPQIRNEIISVPTIDRIVRTVTTPVVETMNCGGGTRLATFTQTSKILPEATGAKTLSEAFRSNTFGAPDGSNNGFFTDGNAGATFTAVQNINSLQNRPATTANRVNIGMIAARPTIFTFPSSVTGTFQEYSDVFSGNSGTSNEQKTTAFKPQR